MECSTSSSGRLLSDPCDECGHQLCVHNPESFECALCGGSDLNATLHRMIDVAEMQGDMIKSLQNRISMLEAAVSGLQDCVIAVQEVIGTEDHYNFVEAAHKKTGPQ